MHFRNNGLTIKSLDSNEIGDWETNENVYNYFSVFKQFPAFPNPCPTATHTHTHTRARSYTHMYTHDYYKASGIKGSPIYFFKYNIRLCTSCVQHLQIVAYDDEEKSKHGKVEEESKLTKELT